MPAPWGAVGSGRDRSHPVRWDGAHLSKRYGGESMDSAAGRVLFQQAPDATPIKLPASVPGQGGNDPESSWNLVRSEGLPARRSTGLEPALASTAAATAWPRRGSRSPSPRLPGPRGRAAEPFHPGGTDPPPAHTDTRIQAAQELPARPEGDASTIT